MKAVRSSNDAIVVPSSGPVYHGQAGQTRTERVHLVEADNSVRSFEVYRVVNVSTDPELKPRALTGQLHRLPDGRELALPFVYHDPAARKFALVIPSSLAHLEMKEWARLMQEVAEDTSAAVPTYVREGTTVLGLGALELFLESGSEPSDEELREVQQTTAEVASERAHELHVREQGLGDREKLVGDREQQAESQQKSLLRMAEDLSARERSLQRREEQLDSARGALSKREQEASAGRAQAAREREASVALAEQRAQQQAQQAATELRNQLQLQIDALRSDHLRSEQQINALRTQLKARETQLERAVAQLAAREQELNAERARAKAREREADVVPEGEWQDVAIEARPVVDEVDTVVAQMPQQPSHTAVTQQAMTAVSPSQLPAIPSERGQPAKSVPPPAASQRPRESAVPSGKNRNSGNPGAARPSKSPTSRPGDGAASRPSSRAEAKSTSPSQRAKSNEILPPPGPQVTSRSRGSDSPPSLQSMAASQRPQAIDESAIPASITPSHRSRANEIPPPAIAAVSRPPSAGDAAPALHGGSTRPRASEAPPASQSVHAPEPAAAARMSSAPARATSAPAVVARVNLAPASAGQSVRPRSEPPVPAEPAQPLPAEALTSIDLRKRLDDPALRMDAIFELCRRGHPAAITPIFKVLGSLSPEDVATTVVCMLALGAGVSGGLVECLDSPSQDVRHAAALGLGQLKVPETLLPLLRRIETETTPSWTEMARALGDYGGPALAIVVRALPSSDRRERLMVGLAHLANHGCAEDLKNLENDPDSAVALASRQALARCTRMQAEDVAVRTQLPLRDNSPEARFSQVFFATLAAAG